MAAPVPEIEAVRGRAMEAALRGTVSTGGEAVLQLLNNSGHEDVASMLTVEGSGPSTQKRAPCRATGEGVQPGRA